VNERGLGNVSSARFPFSIIHSKKEKKKEEEEEKRGSLLRAQFASFG